MGSVFNTASPAVSRYDETRLGPYFGALPRDTRSRAANDTFWSRPQCNAGGGVYAATGWAPVESTAGKRGPQPISSYPRAFANRIGEATTTVGIGAITMGGALTASRAFSSLTAGTPVDYTIEGVTVTTEWEVGRGLWDGSVLNRLIVYNSSNGGSPASLVSLSAGTKNVFVTVSASTFQVLDGMVSVDDFGAVGDGITDDTAAIQAALDYGASAVFCPKTYLTTGPLFLAQSQILYGRPLALQPAPSLDTTDSRILFRPTSGCALACIKNTPGTSANGVQDLTIDIDDARHTGIQFASSYGNVARRIHFRGTLNIGLLAHDTYVCDFDSIVLSGVTVKSFGVFITELSNTIAVRRVHISCLPADVNTCLYGLAFGSGNAHSADDCVIQGCTIGIATNAPHGFVLRNTYFENTLCNARFTDPGAAGGGGAGLTVIGGVWGEAYSYHPQYASRGPVIYLSCSDITLTGLSFETTVNAAGANGPWPIVITLQGPVNLALNNCHHYLSVQKTLVLREVAGANSGLSMVANYESGSGDAPQEIILKDAGNFGTQCHGIRVDSAGTITAVAYQPAIIGGTINALLQTPLPLGATLLL